MTPELPTASKSLIWWSLYVSAAPRLITASRSQTLKEQRGWACVSVCITLLPDFVTNKYCLVRGSAAERKKPERGREEGKEDEKGEREKEEEGQRGREI